MAQNRAKRLSGINTLAYLGIEPITAPLLIVKYNNETPTTQDRAENQIGALWISMDTTSTSNNARIFFLTRLEGATGPSGTATWTEVETGASGSGVDFITTDDANTAVPVLGNINVLGGLTDRGGIDAQNITTYNDPAGSDNVFVALEESIFFPNTTGINSGVIGFGGTGASSRFIHNFGSSNTFVGSASGNFTLTGSNSVGVGDGTLISLTSGDDNTALGSAAGSNIDAGSRNVTVGSSAGATIDAGNDNVAVGYNAMGSVNNDQFVAIGTDTLNLSTSLRNSAVGYQSLNAITINSDNATAFGWHAGFNATGVSSSTFMGANAGAGSTGIRNVFIGQGVGQSGATGSENTGVGTASLQNLTSGGNNNAYGRQSLNSLTTGSNNIAVGNGAASALTTTSDNIAIGNGAAQFASLLSSSVVIGSNALTVGVATGSDNFIIGNGVGTNLTSGSRNVSIGLNCLTNTTAGSENIAFGVMAMDAYIGNGDDDNIAIGENALGSAIQCNDNIAIGANSLGSNASAISDGRGSSNIAIGDRALFTLNPGIVATDSTYNIGIGIQAGFGPITGDHNIFIGRTTGQNYTGAESSNILINNDGINGEDNVLRIGQATGTGNRQINKTHIFGIRGITTANADAVAVLIDSASQLGTISSSARYKDNIQDMDDESSSVMALRPVTFTYKNDEQKRLQYGLIAEEVEQVMPRLVVYDSDGLPQSVRYNDLPQILLNELQKLEKRVSHLENLVSMCTHCS